MKELFEKICFILSLDIEVVQSPRRYKELIIARQIYCKIARDMKMGSYWQIGSILPIDHATVIHSIKMANDRIKFDKEFKTTYDNVLAIVNNLDFNPKKLILRSFDYNGAKVISTLSDNVLLGILTPRKFIKMIKRELTVNENSDLHIIKQNF